MQALVIYDNKGNVWNTTYGDSVRPESLGSAHLEIPDGKQLTGIDLTNPANPQPVFESIPVSDYTRLQNQIGDIEDMMRDQGDEAVAFNVDMDYRLSLMELGL